MENKTWKKGLGRGLSTLLAETKNDIEAENSIEKRGEIYLPIEKIFPNIKQPRKRFERSKLDELSKSIVKNGIIQPVIVRPQGSKFELIAGERRWRAAQLANIHSIPAIIRALTDEEATEYAIVENIQREDLTPIEEARSYKDLLEIYGYTQAEVSGSLGKSRSYIANMLRLLTLPTFIATLLEEGRLTIGHARTLIGLENSEDFAKKIIKDQLSVRQTEALVKKLRSNDSFLKEKKYVKQKKDRDTLNLEKTLSLQTNFEITIEHGKYKESGQLIFNYRDLDELDKICDFLNK